MKKTVITLLAASIFTINYACKSQKKNKESDQASIQQQRPGQGQGQGREQRNGPPNIDEIMSKMDANKDGMLGKDEVKGPLQQDFAKIDTNSDGFLSREEIEKAPKPNRQGPPNGGGGQAPRN